MSYPRDLTPILNNTFGQRFVKVENVPVYKSTDKVIIGRWSKLYEKPSPNYWYGLKARDLDLVDEHSVTHFCYVCDDMGVSLLPKPVVMEQIEDNRLDRSFTKEGKLIHYHIRLFDKGNRMEWKLSGGISRNVENYFHRNKK